MTIFVIPSAVRAAVVFDDEVGCSPVVETSDVVDVILW